MNASTLRPSIEGASLRSAASLIPHNGVVSTSCRAQRPALALPRARAAQIVCFAAPTSIPNPLREEGRVGPGVDEPTSLKPLPKRVEGVVDDPTLRNPLQRMERLGTGWMGVIMELEGVCVDLEYGDVGVRSWQQLAAEEEKSTPPMWALKKSEGMKNEQVVQEVFCCTRNPSEARRLAIRREEILEGLLADRKPLVPAGVEGLLDTLARIGAPVALVSSAPERRVLASLEQAGLGERFEVVISADDVYRGRPDPEGYLYAAQRMGRPPLRCVVVGTSNLSVEAAHEVGMQCVAVAGRHPVFELTAADLVVRSLSELSFINLKQLFRMEEGVMPHSEDGLETEEEEEQGSSALTTVQLMDRPDPPY